MKRALSRREKSLILLFCATVIACLAVIGFSRIIISYKELAGGIERQQTLLNKVSAAAAGPTIDELAQKRDSLKAELSRKDSEIALDSFAFGEKVLSLLGESDLSVRRYRPLEEAAFAISGSGRPENLLIFFKEVSEEHAGWRYTRLNVTPSSEPGAVMFSFDLTQNTIKDGPDER